MKLGIIKKSCNALGIILETKAKELLQKFQAGQSYMLKLFQKTKQIRTNMVGGDPHDDENILCKDKGQ